MPLKQEAPSLGISRRDGFTAANPKVSQGVSPLAIQPQGAEQEGECKHCSPLRSYAGIPLIQG